MPYWTVVTRKSLGGYRWANTWHLDADTLIAAKSGAAALTVFERELLPTTVTMDDYKLSKWPNPTGQEFWIEGIGLAGMRVMANPQPAEMCLFVGIEAAQGHHGKKWLRCSLDEADVTTSVGRPVLVTGSTAGARFVDARGDLIEALNGAACLLLIGSNPAAARQSTNDLGIEGIGFRDLDVGWYNRTT